ncbi:MAG: hypothetical protein ACPG4J_07885 [Lentibacter algarum]
MLNAITCTMGATWTGLRAGCTTLLCAGVLLAGSGAYAQDGQNTDGRRAAALEALGLINADVVELNRIADYQSELLGLAKADKAAASLARRGRGSCAERSLVRELCTALPVSFPARPQTEGQE